MFNVEMDRPVTPLPVITGVGLLTALGQNAEQTWQAVLAGASIRDHARLKPRIALDQPRITSLALQAALEALSQSRWMQRDNPQRSSTIIVGTSKGPIESWLTPPPSTSDKPSNRADCQGSDHDNPSAKPAMSSPVFGLASTADALARHIGFESSPRLTVSAACASGLHALIRAAIMIRAGEASRVLVVAAEASVHPLFLASFRRLGVLPPEGVPCRPFDQDRQGFLMSEAAAAVCLEAHDPDATNVRPIAVVERFALGGDASHLTAGDASGSTLRRLLQEVIRDNPVDLVHAHGTGTPFNDPIELAAIESVLREDQRPAALYSHKGAIGHSLGAAGLVSVVLNCLAHASGEVPPNVNTPNPLISRRMIITQQTRQHSLRRSIACASGFGGPVAVVSLTTV